MRKNQKSEKESFINRLFIRDTWNSFYVPTGNAQDREVDFSKVNMLAKVLAVILTFFLTTAIYFIIYAINVSLVDNLLALFVFLVLSVGFYFIFNGLIKKRLMKNSM